MATKRKPLKSVKRPSQATRKRPTARLVRRRVATAKGPKGFYANPVKVSDYYRVEWSKREEGPWTTAAYFVTRTGADEYANALFKHRSMERISVRVVRK